MGSVNIRRWGGIAAALGGLLGLVLAPVTAAATKWSYYPYTGWSDDVPELVRPLRFYVEPLLAMAPPYDVYPTFGRTLIAVFLLLFAAVMALRSLPLQPRRGWLNTGLWLAVVGAAMQLIGNFGDYWLGEELLGHQLWGVWFAAGTLLGSLIFATGSFILGIVFVRRQLLPWWASLPLVAWPFFGIVFLFWGMIHIPSSWVLPMGAAWLLVGIAHLLPRRASAGGPLFTPKITLGEE